MQRPGRYLAALQEPHEAATSLPYERTGHESDESHGGTHNRCFPAAKHVCEDTDYGAAEEDHAHGQRAYPRWKRGRALRRKLHSRHSI